MAKVLFRWLSDTALATICDAIGIEMYHTLKDGKSYRIFTFSDALEMVVPRGYAVWRDEIRAILAAGYYPASDEPFASNALTSVQSMIAAVRDGAAGSDVRADFLECIAAAYLETPTNLPPKPRKGESKQSRPSQNTKAVRHYLASDFTWNGTAFVPRVKA